MKLIGVQFNDYGIDYYDYLVVVDDQKAEATVEKLTNVAGDVWTVEILETTTPEAAIKDMKNFLKETAE